MSEWRTHVDKSVVFGRCEICSKQTEGECWCEDYYCWQHMRKHLEGCKIALERAT